jgi:hypothetical protein
MSFGHGRFMRVHHRFVTIALILFLLSNISKASSIYLSWTSPGDDGTIGKASLYDLRYSTSLITDQNWTNAIRVTGLPVPQTYGRTETVIISGLTPNTVYYFALRAADEKYNWSKISNNAKKMTCSGCFGATGNVDGSADGSVDLSDLSLLGNFLIGIPVKTFCFEEANVDGSPDGLITISDLSYLISYLTADITSLPACP